MPGWALTARLLWAALLGLALACAAPAQESQSQSPVLIVDQERMFEQSAFGRRAVREIRAAAAELAAENRVIEAELEAEERALTEQRPGMDPAAFAELARAFDAKVVEIRDTQRQKERDILALPDAARWEFFAAAAPILSEFIRERGAVAILDEKAVLLSLDAIDITDEAIQRIDARLGDGTDALQNTRPRSP